MLSFILLNSSLSFLFFFLAFFRSHKELIKYSSIFNSSSSSLLSSLFSLFSSNSMNIYLLESLWLSSSSEEELSSFEYIFFFFRNLPLFLFFLRSFFFIITFLPFYIRTFGRKITNFTIIETFKRKLTFELVGSSFRLSQKVGLFFIIWVFTIAIAWAIFSLLVVFLCLLGDLQCCFLSRWLFLFYSHFICYKDSM